MTMPERSLAASAAEPSRFPSSGLSPAARADHDRMANAIRALAMDAVEKANSGHPGLPMGAADIATVLVHALSQIRPGRSGLARPRPLRALGRPRLDAALCAPASHRLRGDDHRRAQALPPARLAHPRPPGARPHPRRRNHHRTARPRPGQCGRHGDRGAAPRRRVRQRHCRSRDLRARFRRRPDGRHQPGSHCARRAPQAEQADRAVRRQRHFDRRAIGAYGFRRPGETLRGGRLGGRPHRRPRSGGDCCGDRSGEKIRAAVDDRLPHHHRLWRADQGRQGIRPRLGARRQRDRGRARKARLDFCAVRSSDRHPRGVARRRRARKTGAAGLERAPRRERSAASRRIRAPPARRAVRATARRGARAEGKAQRLRRRRSPPARRPSWRWTR